MNAHNFGGKWLDDLNLELRGSDRACAILSGAIIDERLKSLIQKFLLPSSNIKNDKLLGRTAPIESFSSRIELARRLNLISDATCKSLNWIRDIRNSAAHKENFSLEENSYKDKINNLIIELKIKEKAPSLIEKPYDEPKGHFVSVVIMIVISLELEEKETNQTEHKPTDALSNYSISDNNG